MLLCIFKVRGGQKVIMTSNTMSVCVCVCVRRRRKQGNYLHKTIHLGSKN